MPSDRSDTTDDYAKSWRRDLRGGLPVCIILPAARRHVSNLKKLPEHTPDRDQAIRDMERFVLEIANAE